MVWVVWLNLRRTKEQARSIRFENFRIGQSLSNRIIEQPIRILIDLEASQVPTVSIRLSKLGDDTFYFVESSVRTIRVFYVAYAHESNYDILNNRPRLDSIL